MNSNTAVTLGYLALVFGAMYFLIYRPNAQRQKAQAELQRSLGIGDEVVTTGGLLGTVRTLDEDGVGLEVADGVVVRVLRSAVVGKT